MHLEHVAGRAGDEATGRACTSKHTNNLALYELLQLVDVATVTAGAGRADSAGELQSFFRPRGSTRSRECN
ncbi:hypothetical protein, partial [Pseudomonas sp. RIT-PI-AD]|uniref:hypothetical protein n=1 Tax=Pseudomonas sp. RIT-PI-AD TaxID=3035294 RepID=UPI0021D8F2D5